MGAGPAAVPSGNPGQQAASMSTVREAIKLLEKALPGLHPGSEPYKAVLNSMQSLGKYIPPSAEVPGVQATTAQGLNNDAQKSAMMAMLRGGNPSAGMGAGAGGGPASPSGPPAPAMPPSLAAA